MRLNKFFMGVLGALALTACSSEEIIPDKNGPVDEGKNRYMSVSIRNANPDTRAEGGQTADGNNIYEDGFSAENNVKNLRFYFFDKEGNPAPITYNGLSYFDCAETDISEGNTPNDNPNIEKVLNAVIVISSNVNEGDRNIINQMVAIANYDNIKNQLGTGTAANKSLSQLMDIVGNVSELNVTDQSKGFVMTSSSFHAEDGYGCAVQIKDTDIKADEKLAKANPVDVYIERAVAKVRVKTDWKHADMGLDNNGIKTVTFEGESYQAIPLSSKVNGVLNPIYTTNNGTERVYVIFKNWDLWWTADQAYLFKKVGNWDKILGKWWNHEGFHRSYWAMNPDNTKLIKHPHNFTSKKIITSATTDATSKYSDYSAYCLENAADSVAKDGTKFVYDPQKRTSNRTLAYLSAVLVTIKDDVATPVSLAEWAGYKYTEKGVIDAMFKPNENIIYFRSKDPVSSSGSITNPDGTTTNFGEHTYKMIALTVDDLELVSGMNAGMADDKIEVDKRYLSYVNLKENIFKGKDVEPDKLYKRDGDIYTEINREDVNTLLESIGGAKVWRDGNTYYYHDITHLGTEAEKGLYGVVRNHIYEVVINSVFGLGTPVLSPKDGSTTEPWEDITPQKPTPDAYFLGARVNILSWRVVNNNTSLDW